IKHFDGKLTTTPCDVVFSNLNLQSAIGTFSGNAKISLLDKIPQISGELFTDRWDPSLLPAKINLLNAVGGKLVIHAKELILKDRVIKDGIVDVNFTDKTIKWVPRPETSRLPNPQ